MSYMEQQAQQQFDASENLRCEMEEKHEPPSDYGNPDWDNTGKCHDWKNYVYLDDMRKEWSSLPEVHKLLLATCFQSTADREHWD